MHGGGERGNDNELQLTHGAALFAKEENRQKYPAIILFPQCAKDDYWTHVERNDKNWAYPFHERPTKSMQLAMDLLEETILKEAVDVDRIYITGLSMGGMGTFDLLARQPHLFAAAAPICGGGNVALTGLYAKNTPFWIFHGDADAVVPVDLSRKMYQALKGQGANVKYTEYPGVNHNSWDNVFADTNYLAWIFAQRRISTNQRYKLPVFEAVEKKTYTYAQKAGIALDLDIYQPQNDQQIKRPLLLYVHGGGFSGGRRDEEHTIKFAEQLVKSGYVVASISYRLTMKGQSFGCDQPTPNKIKTFQLAVEDIWSATNFLLENADKFGVDSTKIALAGSSAGAEAILHAGYWTSEHLLTESPKLPNNFKYAALISMAGAIIDLNLITAQNAIPTQFFHGTCDPLVPYGSAAHHYCGYGDAGYLMLHGAASITTRLKDLEQPFHTITFCGGKHEWAGSPMRLYTEDMITFLHDNLITKSFKQIHRVVNLTENDCSVGISPTVCPRN
ncbi:MAG: alpha/beta hydrolase fold domain-containing protein [Saprospiraceae bacterium]|nr:alpha/beta hydrolase fold domain-containing protein [Saprospiraceae bacterium]